MKRTGFFACAALLLAIVSADVSGQSLRKGDVTINPSSEADVECEDCPGGTGTKLSYEVKLDFRAQNVRAEDFHILTKCGNNGDGDAANFKCFLIEQRNAQGVFEEVKSWNGGLRSQVEDDDVRKYYASWWRSNGPWLARGNTFRFSFIYCGNDNNLDNSVDWILTEDGSQLPDPPDDNGNRGNVPDIGKNDDPGWKGRRDVAAGADVGFITVFASQVPVSSTLSLAAVTLLLLVAGAWLTRR